MKFITTRYLLELCADTKRTLGAQVGMGWWEKEGIDLTWARERTSTAADADEDGGEH